MASKKNILDSFGWFLEKLKSNFVKKSGDTMTGSLTISKTEIKNNDAEPADKITVSLPKESGTLMLEPESVTKNYVYAGPSSADGKPEFRVLTSDDMPEFKTLNFAHVSTVSSRTYISGQNLSSSYNNDTNTVRLALTPHKIDKSGYGSIVLGRKTKTSSTIYNTRIIPSAASSIEIFLPGKGGTLALKSDISDILTSNNTFTGSNEFTKQNSFASAFKASGTDSLSDCNFSVKALQSDNEVYPAIKFTDENKQTEKNASLIWDSGNDVFCMYRDGWTQVKNLAFEDNVNTAIQSATSKYLPLTGGTITGTVLLDGSTDLRVGPSCNIYFSGNDSNYGPGYQLNNLVFSSWYGVSFTTTCDGSFKNKTAVGIDCRTGTIKSYDAEISSGIRFIYGSKQLQLLKGDTFMQVWNATDARSLMRVAPECVYVDTLLGSPSCAANWTSNGANVYMSDSGLFYHVGSASKFKLDIQDIHKEENYAYNLLKINPKQWFDKSETERYAEYLTAQYNGEEISDEDKIKYADCSTNQYYGLIAEDVEAAGLKEFCSYDENNELNGIKYDRIPILMIPILRDLVSYLGKISPYLKDSITDEKLLAELKVIENRFLSFNEKDIVELQYNNN